MLDRASLGEFSLAPSQGPVLALYVPMERLQRDLDLGDRVNTLLVKGVGDLVDPRISEDQLDVRPSTLDDLRPPRSPRRRTATPLSRAAPA